MPRRYLILLALAASLLSACSDVPYRQRQEDRLAEYQKFAGEPIDKFHYFHMEDWEVLGPNTIALRTSPRDTYLITVEKVCPQLQWAHTVGVTSSSGEVHRRFDSVIVRGINCHIEEIRPVRYREMIHEELARSK